MRDLSIKSRHAHRSLPRNGDCSRRPLSCLQYCTGKFSGQHRDAPVGDLLPEEGVMLAVYGEKPGYECWRWK